jgi:HEPN domain-containing protein/predicted nucleotidyltransferase
MTEALSRPKPRIDNPEELERVVRRLVEGFEPIAIYLFGSRARGEARKDSDYDLMLVLADDSTRVRSRQAVWDTARSERIAVNPFLTRTEAFAWRRHEVGTLEYEVQIDGIRLHPVAGADLRATVAHDDEEPGSMNAKVVAEWLRRVERDLRTARLCCETDDPMPDQAAYHVQQAAGKLTKAALVAVHKRPRKGHQIGEFARRLPATFAGRERFLTLDRFSDYVWAHRYPEEDLSRPAPPEPSVAEARAWIAEVEALKVDFERWLGAREARS